MSGRGARRCQGGHGQATVEVALVLPFVALAVMAVVQVGVVVHDQVLVTAAAREAVRAAAVSPDEGAPARAARAVGGLDHAKMRIESTRPGASGDPVHVQATYRATTDLPLVGLLIPDVDLRADAAMRSEW